MCEAVDEWMGQYDSHALARREAEALDVASPGRGYSTDVERLERRLAQQEKALEGFGVKVEKQQEKNDTATINRRETTGKTR